MQGNARRKNPFFVAVILVLSVAAGGCVELKYSAQDRLTGPVAIKSSRAIQSVYFSFPAVRPGDKPYCDYFTAAFAEALQKNGFVAADTASGADIVIKAKAVFYRKAQGTFLFVLIIPTYRFNEEYDGIAMTVTYKTDKGRSHKKYRVYYRGWLDGDRDIASNTLLKEIIKDISPASGGKKSK
jgi:hypothetical protein